MNHKATPKISKSYHGGFDPRHAQGYIFLTLLFAIIGASALFFTSQAPDKTLSNQAEDLKKLEVIKRALINNILTGVDGLDIVGEKIKGFNDYPGVILCPENIDNIGKAIEGNNALRKCHTANDPVKTGNIGRYAWRTLSTDQLVDSAGEPFWVVVDPEFTRGNLSFTSLSRKINMDTEHRLSWKDQEVVAVIFAPGKAVSTQTRPEISKDNPPQYQNYLEITNPIASLSGEPINFRPITQDDDPSCTKSKNCPNDLFVSISRREWLDAVSSRIGSFVIKCIAEEKEEIAKNYPPFKALDALVVSDAPAWHRFETTPPSATPSIFQAIKNDPCENAFIRVHNHPSESDRNKVYTRINRNQKLRSCYAYPLIDLPIPDSFTVSTTPSICFSAEDELTAMSIESTLPSTLDKVLIKNDGGFDVPSDYVDCSNKTTKDKYVVCKDDRWLSNWVDNIYVMKSDSRNIRILKDNGQSIETNILFLLKEKEEGTTPPQRVASRTACEGNSSPSAIVAYPSGAPTDYFCIDASMRTHVN